MFMRPFLFIGAVIFSLYWFLPGSEIARVPGVLAPDEPVQRELFTSSFHEQNGYRIAPLATFDIRARVISAARYHFGREADLAPVDLVLGWGAISDSNVLKQISFSQSGRAYTWWTKTWPVPRDKIESHSANMHMIPANPDFSPVKKNKAALYGIRAVSPNSYAKGEARPYGNTVYNRTNGISATGASWSGGKI
jgi:hypothetical protein